MPKDDSERGQLIINPLPFTVAAKNADQLLETQGPEVLLKCHRSPNPEKSDQVPPPND